MAFTGAVTAVFNSWSALQFAIEQQTGGSSSKEKGKWMIDVTETFFNDNDDLEPEEVADFLSSIMNDEMNILVDDGSDLEVSSRLCRLYSMYKMNDLPAMEVELKSLPHASTIAPHPELEQVVEESDISNQVQSMTIDESVGLNDSEELDSRSSPSSKDDDGWITVTKTRRKTAQS